MSGPPLPRGTVTFLFSDIEGSSSLIRQLGDAGFAAARAEHHRLLRAAFAAHGGREIDTAGDGFFVAFDSARSAARAAISAQLALAHASWPANIDVRVRIGLHTAEPHLDAHGYVGLGVHRAARICDAGRGGQILLSNATAGIIEVHRRGRRRAAGSGRAPPQGNPRDQRLFQLTVPGLPSEFGPPRTAEAAIRVPGVGTFVASELSGWRHVIRAVGDEASARLAADYHAAVTAAVDAHHGVVLERVADSALAVFHNASDAVAAAARIRDGLADIGGPGDCEVNVSIVVHSGRWSGDPKGPAAGMALFRLSRLAQIAEPGQVLVSQTTVALLEGDRDMPKLCDLGEQKLPDFDVPMRIYQLSYPRFRGASDHGLMTMGRKIRGNTKKYPDELRQRAVRLYRESNPKPKIRRLAEQLGVHHEALRNWIRRPRPMPGSAMTGRHGPVEENRRLAKENAELRRANEIPEGRVRVFRGGAVRHVALIDRGG
jgi:class 3 adenylate cyclase/transposase-like protein